ncbi:MAG: glycosyltransferase family 1 protein [Microbacterium sp.]
MLQDKYEVVTVSRGESPFDDVPHVQLPDAQQRWGVVGRFLYLTALTLRTYPLITRVSAQDHAIREALGEQEFDLVIAHDVQTAVVAEQQAPQEGVLVDLHEYAPRQNEHSRTWRWLIAPYFRWIIRGPVRRATATTTVSEGIVNEYATEFDLDPQLVINASPFQDRKPTPVHTPLRLVHSGVAAPHRHLEILIDAVLLTTAELTLDLYLVGADSDYGRELRMRASVDPRIRIHEPVAYEKLIPTLADHDIGVHILPPINFNHLHALPNKLFDYVQARLGVIIGPSPEMQRIVDQYEIGTVTVDFTPQALAEALNHLDPADVTTWKSNSHTHAHELSSESQVRVWREMVDDILGEEKESPYDRVINAR